MKPNKKKGYEKSTIEAHLKQKQKYSESLKINIQHLAKENHLESFGIFEKIRDVVPDEMISNKTGIFMHRFLEKEEEFVDPVYSPTMPNLEPLKRSNMNFISWFRIKNFFKDGKFCLFNDIRIKNQVLRDRGYSYLVDAMNTLSTQPGLIIRMFEYTEINSQGIYSIWLNINGIWKEFLIDDYVPIFSTKEGGKAQFYFCSPNQDKREIWMILLQKALAKAYGGFHRLYNGNTAYALRDFTGAPVTTLNIVYISEKQKVTQREVGHMDSLWKKITNNLEKGYLLSFVPRKPNKLETKRNEMLTVFNKKYFLGNGVYSGHNYAILSARAVRSSKGEEVRIIQLRNPWINEKWEGDFCKDSDLWTEEVKQEVGYDPAKNGESQFWIPVKDCMNYFEHLKVCKVIPGYTYNSIKLKYPQKNFLRAVVRFHVPKKGKYTLSVDQQDIHFSKNPKHQYSSVKLTLCKLEDNEFQLLSHTSSECLRNTFIRKLIDVGEYYVLIEQKCPDSNIKYEKEVKGGGDAAKANEIKNWRNSVFSIYGPQTCGIKIIECEEIHVIHDYLIYEGWKSYAKMRIGNKLTDFKLTFDDGHKGDLAIYILSVPKMIIYAFKNNNGYGVDINTEIMGIKNMEIVGPEGKVGFNQHFKIDSGSHDVFILREVEDKEVEADGSVINGGSTFKMKSIVGTRYTGNKDVSKNQAKVYDFLYFDKPSTGGCMIEKFPQLKMANLYDCGGNEVSHLKVTGEIKMKTKSIVEPVRIKEEENQKEFVIEDSETAAPAAQARAVDHGASPEKLQARHNSEVNIKTQFKGAKAEQEVKLPEISRRENLTRGIPPGEPQPMVEVFPIGPWKKTALKFSEQTQILGEKKQPKNNQAVNTRGERPKSILKKKQNRAPIDSAGKNKTPQDTLGKPQGENNLRAQSPVPTQYLPKRGNSQPKYQNLDQQRSPVAQQYEQTGQGLEQVQQTQQIQQTQQTQQYQQQLQEDQQYQQQIQEKQAYQQQQPPQHQQTQQYQPPQQAHQVAQQQQQQPPQETENQRLAAERRAMTEMDDTRLANLLALSKEEILLIDNDELLKLIKYTGIDAFVNLYQADPAYLERLYRKLGQGDESASNEPRAQSPSPAQQPDNPSSLNPAQEVQAHQQQAPPQYYQPQQPGYANLNPATNQQGHQPQHLSHNQSYLSTQAPHQHQGYAQGSLLNTNQKEQRSNSHLMSPSVSQQKMAYGGQQQYAKSPGRRPTEQAPNNRTQPEEYMKDFSMVERSRMKNVGRKVARPSFLDKPKQQGTGPSKDYQRIMFEETHYKVPAGGSQKGGSYHQSHYKNTNDQAAAPQNNQVSNNQRSPTGYVMSKQDYGQIRGGNQGDAYGSPGKKPIRQTYPNFSPRSNVSERDFQQYYYVNNQSQQPQVRVDLDSRRNFALPVSPGRQGYENHAQQSPQEQEPYTAPVVDLQFEEYEPNHSNFNSSANNNQNGQNPGLGGNRQQQQSQQYQNQYQVVEDNRYYQTEGTNNWGHDYPRLQPLQQPGGGYSGNTTAMDARSHYSQQQQQQPPQNSYQPPGPGYYDQRHPHSPSHQGGSSHHIRSQQSQQQQIYVNHGNNFEQGNYESNALQNYQSHAAPPQGLASEKSVNIEIAEPFESRYFDAPTTQQPHHDVSYGTNNNHSYHYQEQAPQGYGSGPQQQYDRSYRGHSPGMRQPSQQSQQQLFEDEHRFNTNTSYGNQRYQPQSSLMEEHGRQQDYLPPGGGKNNNILRGMSRSKNASRKSLVKGNFYKADRITSMNKRQRSKNNLGGGNTGGTNNNSTAGQNYSRNSYNQSRGGGQGGYGTQGQQLAYDNCGAGRGRSNNNRRSSDKRSPINQRYDNNLRHRGDQGGHGQQQNFAGNLSLQADMMGSGAKKKMNRTSSLLQRGFHPSSKRDVEMQRGQRRSNQREQGGGGQRGREDEYYDRRGEPANRRSYKF